MRARDDGEIGTLHRGPQECLRCIPANPAALVHIEITYACVVATIENVGGGKAGFLRRLRKSFQYFPFQPLLLDAPFAARTMPFICTAVMIFTAFEHG